MAKKMTVLLNLLNNDEFYSNLFNPKIREIERWLINHGYANHFADFKKRYKALCDKAEIKSDSYNALIEYLTENEKTELHKLFKNSDPMRVEAEVSFKKERQNIIGEVREFKDWFLSNKDTLNLSDDLLIDFFSEINGIFNNIDTQPFDSLESLDSEMPESSDLSIVFVVGEHLEYLQDIRYRNDGEFLANKLLDTLDSLYTAPTVYKVNVIAEEWSYLLTVISDKNENVLKTYFDETLGIDEAIKPFDINKITQHFDDVAQARCAESNVKENDQVVLAWTAKVDNSYESYNFPQKIGDMKKSLIDLNESVVTTFADDMQKFYEERVQFVTKFMTKWDGQNKDDYEIKINSLVKDILLDLDKKITVKKEELLKSVASSREAPAKAPGAVTPDTVIPAAQTEKSLPSGDVGIKIGLTASSATTGSTVLTGTAPPVDEYATSGMAASPFASQRLKEAYRKQKSAFISRLPNRDIHKELDELTDSKGPCLKGVYEASDDASDDIAMTIRDTSIMMSRYDSIATRNAVRLMIVAKGPKVKLEPIPPSLPAEIKKLIMDDILVVKAEIKAQIAQDQAAQRPGR